MSSRTEQSAVAPTPELIAQHWLDRFGVALALGAAGGLARLFRQDAHWRDVLAFTWRIDTVSGADAIAVTLGRHADCARQGLFELATGHTEPRMVIRAAVTAIEAIFQFKTVDGHGNGIVRLTQASAGGEWQAWTLLTTLEDLSAHTAAPANATEAKAYARDFRGPNWLDNRRRTLAYADRDPAVLVVGAGQAGLAIAARLGQLGIDTLVVDKEARIGDNWRKRYHALVLHNQTHVNHLPYMPFPATWPAYVPKDKLANWFEAYAESLELNVWTETMFDGGAWDVDAGRWTCTLRKADGSTRVMRPRHVVMAVGASAIPHVPTMPTLDAFKGTVLHTHAYQDGERWRGKAALVVGTGTSGHDIAQDLYSNGATVTLVQRAPTMVVNVEPSAQLPYALYSEGPSLEDCDLITLSVPLALSKRSHQLMTAEAKRLDQPLLDGLERIGFRLDYGEDGTGWQFKYLTRGGGYYFNVGCSELLVSGLIGLVQYADIERFATDGIVLRGGEHRAIDLIVLATGYEGQGAMVRRLFGDAIANRVGPIWGFGDGQELRNMYQRTPQPGLWFIAGSLAQCRIYSKYLALQIAAKGS